MSDNYFEIIRPGINTTFQDKGRDHLYHIGIPFSGAMDNRNYLIANKLVNNNLDSAVVEFAYQGPHIKYSGEKINFAVTGDVIFTIKKNNAEIEGNCYQSYQIENGDEINIGPSRQSASEHIRQLLIWLTSEDSYWPTLQCRLLLEGGHIHSASSMEGQRGSETPGLVLIESKQT